MGDYEVMQSREASGVITFSLEHPIPDSQFPISYNSRTCTL